MDRWPGDVASSGGGYDESPDQIDRGEEGLLDDSEDPGDDVGTL